MNARKGYLFLSARLASLLFGGKYAFKHALELDDNDAHMCMYNIYADASLQKELSKECDFQLSVFRLTPGRAHNFFIC